MRIAEIIRKTNETDIKLTLNLDGSGISEISTGSGFMDHMLELFAAHGKFDLQIERAGDVILEQLAFCPEVLKGKVG